MTWLTVMEYMCHKWTQICSTCRKHFPFPHSWLIIGFVTNLTWQMPLVEQELLTLLEHPSLPSVFSGVRVTRSLVLCICRSLFVLLYFFFWPLCCLFFDIRILQEPMLKNVFKISLSVATEPFERSLDKILLVWFSATCMFCYD
jgi:hypothetical protein